MTGDSANDYTSFTKTAYIYSATTDIERNTKTLIDFVQEPYFSEESVENEKGIIEQEIQLYDDQPDWRAFFVILGAIFEKHQVNIVIATISDILIVCEINKKRHTKSTNSHN